MSALPQEVTIRLGLSGSLIMVFPSGRSIELPVGEAEARIVETLDGFRKDLRTYKAEHAPKRFANIAVPPEGIKPKVFTASGRREDVSLEDLGI